MADTPNYDFILEQVANRCGRHARVLDFGCGGGELVAKGRALGLDMVGADPFADCPDLLQKHRRAGALGKMVFEMPANRLPFPDRSFDAVCANQVFEHVVDLNLALAEIGRVLSPGGVLVSLTPTLEVLREGHCGVPLAQRFQGAPRLQFAYLLTGRLLGFGLWKGSKSPMQWALQATAYIDERPSYA